MAKKKEEPTTTLTVPAAEPATATPEPEEAKQGKPCPNCGKKVGSRAATCPFCKAVIPPKEKKEGTGTRKPRQSASVPLTLPLLKLAKQRAEEDGGTVAELLAQVNSIIDLADEFGSIENLRDCLDFWIEAGASK